MPPAQSKEQRKLLLTLVASVVILDGIIIGIYYGTHIADRPVKTQETFIAVWVVLTALVVATQMKKIRRARRPVR